MAKVAFWFDAPIEYSGGLNYFKNLLYALSLVNDGSIKPCIYFAAGVPAGIDAQFAPHATVVRTKLLQRGTLAWFAHKVLYKLLGSMWLVNARLKADGIDVLSHAWFVYKGRPSFPIIGWIPDFQYLHLPELFPTLNTEEETRQNQRIIAQSDIVILSSHDALGDFKRITSAAQQSRAAVMQFVSQPGHAASAPTITRAELERKYGFQGPFFHLPNQFWAHKNHMVVLQAVAALKQQGVEVLVICSGNTRDYRIQSTAYIDGIHAFIDTQGLKDQVKILGHIDYGDVLALMKHALAVLNPSRFEGWCSSVEEAKSMGKPVVLSNIGVHVEQNPLNGQYFAPDDEKALARILADVWQAPASVLHADAAQQAQRALQQRTVDFGQAYVAILERVLKKPLQRVKLDKQAEEV